MIDMRVESKVFGISAPSSAAALFFSAQPTDAREERVFVLPLDGSGRVLAEPIPVSLGHKEGTAPIDPGAIFREALKVGAEVEPLTRNGRVPGASTSKEKGIPNEFV